MRRIYCLENVRYAMMSKGVRLKHYFLAWWVWMHVQDKHRHI